MRPRSSPDQTPPDDSVRRKLMIVDRWLNTTLRVLESSIINQQSNKQRFSLKAVPWRHNIFYCTQCHKKYPTHHKLFDTLHDSSKMAAERVAGRWMLARTARESRLSTGRRRRRLQGYYRLPPPPAGVMARQRGRKSHLLPVSGRVRWQGGRQIILLDALLARCRQRSPLRPTCHLSRPCAVRSFDCAGS